MLKQSTYSLVLTGAIFAVLTSSGFAQEWTRFHGPNGTGVSEAKGIPDQWTEADYNWTTDLPGIGHSSPVVWGQKIFLLSADPRNATRFVLCVDAATGKILWNRRFSSKSHHLHSRSSFASSTPAVDEDHVYVAWSTPDKTSLLAFTHDGKDAWERDLGPWVSQHGFGTSPIVYQNMVILSNSQQEEQITKGEPGESFMMAFDRKSGKEIWRTPRKSVRVCYSVPCIYEGPSGPELVCCNTGNGVYSLNPMTGKLNWEIEAFSMRTVASPTLAGGKILGSTGSGKGGNYVVAVQPGKEISYKIPTSAPYVPTPVTRGDLVFLWFDHGIVTCIDASTGKVHWRNRVGGGFSGSPVRVRDRVYCISESGEVVVIAAEKEFKLISRNPLGGDSRATPAVSGGRMYLRTYSKLFSIGGKSS